uniref:Facilitated trehalose transporter n=1 Tax=Anoplophora glabripennis TaxID=217634 RepID=V5GZR2_ANOGL
MGLAVGGTFIVVPIYIGEISDKNNRGAMCSTMSCFACFGILFSCCLGPYVNVTIFNLALAVFPVAFLVLFSLLATETPHFFVREQENVLAKIVLEKIRSGDEIVDKELKEIQTAVEEEDQGTFLDSIKSKGVVRAFVISVGLLIFQQLSGINAVLFYGQQIFQQAGEKSVLLHARYKK